MLLSVKTSFVYMSSISLQFQHYLQSNTLSTLLAEHSSCLQSRTFPDAWTCPILHETFSWKTVFKFSVSCPSQPLRTFNANWCKCLIPEHLNDAARRNQGLTTCREWKGSWTWAKGENSWEGGQDAVQEGAAELRSHSHKQSWSATCYKLGCYRRHH